MRRGVPGRRWCHHTGLRCRCGARAGCRCPSPTSWSSVAPVELVRTCARVAQAPVTTGATETTEAKIYTFLPAVGGAGVTTLALQSRDAAPSTWPGGRFVDLPGLISISARCLADYLDLDAAHLNEIEPRPERLVGSCGGDAFAPSVRPRRDRGAQSAGRDAFVHPDVVTRRSTWSRPSSTMSCSTCRAPGSPGPTAFCSARMSCSSSAR